MKKPQKKPPPRFQVFENILTFGKHKGWNIKNVPTNYLLWIVNSMGKLDSISFRQVTEMLESRGIEWDTNRSKKALTIADELPEPPKKIECDLPLEEVNRIRKELGLPILS